MDYPNCTFAGPEDAEWRVELDPESPKVVWRCRALRLEYRFYMEAMRQHVWFPREGLMHSLREPTPARVALWEDLFLHPGNPEP